LLGEDVGGFGCGGARSFAEYEAYAGLSFRHRAAQDATLRGETPPNAPAAPDWPMEEREWRVRIVLDRATLPLAALAAPRLWYVGVHDADNKEIYRQDAVGEELRSLAEGVADQIVIERSFDSIRRPLTWTIWPVGRDGEWAEKATGAVDLRMR
jgi:hypothetical protein